MGWIEKTRTIQFTRDDLAVSSKKDEQEFCLFLVEQRGCNMIQREWGRGDERKGDGSGREQRGRNDDEEEEVEEGG